MSAAVNAYVAGVIDEETLEKRLETELLLEFGRAHPVPDGWEPLPPCDHEWVDITGFGSATRHCLCARCGDQVAS